MIATADLPPDHDRDMRLVGYIVAGLLIVTFVIGAAAGAVAYHFVRERRAAAFCDERR